MSSEIDQASTLLLEARRSAQPLNLPSWQPTDQATAYLIQERVSTALGPVGGWKTGASAPGVQAIAAPLPASRVWRSPATLVDGEFRLRGIELEVAFLLAEDLPPRPTDYSLDEVLAAVSGVHAAIEVVESRFTDMASVPPLWKLADHQCNGGFVAGEPLADWQARDLASLPVNIKVNGQLVMEKTGTNPVGDPRRLLAFLANHCKGRGGLRAGQWITTGSYIGILPVTSGALVQAKLAGAAEVSLRFA